MKSRQSLVEAIRDEDQLLRRYVSRLPRDRRETRGPDGSLSCKETLGHIAFWDDFTVEFFACKLDIAAMTPPPPVNFEERSRAALLRIEPLPYGEVLGQYLEATGALLAFIEAHWDELTEREKHDFWVPLKHRRHHRISLMQGTEGILAGSGGSDERRMAAGA